MNQEKYLKFHEALFSDAINFLSETRNDIARWGGGPTLDQELAWLVDEIVDADVAELYPRLAVPLIACAGLLAGNSTAESFQQFGARGRELSARKNNDYARPQDHAENPFAVFKNFLKCEALGVCSVEAGFLVRLSDKVSRCCNLLGSATGPSVVDEKLEDTLLDLANYSILLMAYIETKKIEGAKK